jgi:DNA repair exonuclease SbcCD ATPase subunit
METYAFNMEIMLRNEMDATDDAKYQLRKKDEKIEQLENTIQKLKEKNASLEATNDNSYTHFFENEGGVVNTSMNL